MRPRAVFRSRSDPTVAGRSWRLVDKQAGFGLHLPSEHAEGRLCGWLERVTTEAWPDAPTLFDTEPLRRLVASKRNQADPELVRAVMGFDAILVMSGSTASANL